MSIAFMDIDVKPGDRILIGGHLVTIEFIKKSGQLARLRIGAPPQVPVKKELHDAGRFVARMTA